MISRESALRIRKQLQMTQVELADLIGASQVTVSRYETGEKKVSYHYIKRIADATDLDIFIRCRANDFSDAFIPGLD